MTIQKYETSVKTSGTAQNWSQGAGIIIGGARGDNSTSTALSVTLTNIKFYGIVTELTSGSANGGAITYIDSSSATNTVLNINECMFLDNFADGTGGAMYIGDGATVNMQNSLVQNNKANKGGAIFLEII